MEKQGPRLQPGDVVFFKACSRDHGRKAKQIAFKGGTGFAAMLGIVPPNGAPPLEKNLMMLMGSAGFMAFDDVAKFLGPEAAAECIKKFELAYYPSKEKAEAQAKEAGEQAKKQFMNGKEPSRLILPFKKDEEPEIN